MDWNETVIPVGKGDEGFDVSPDGRELWTANAQDGTLSVIDIAAKKVIATLDAKVTSANRLKFTPDGKYVLISCLGKGDLVIYDAASRQEFKRVHDRPRSGGHSAGCRGPSRLRRLYPR